MANEISVSLRVTVANGNLKDTVAPGLKQEDQTNGLKFDQVYSVGAGAEESVTSFGDLTTPGLIVIENLDGTNYVELGFATADRDLVLKPGGLPFLAYGSANTQFFWKADTAACNVRLRVYDQ